VPSRAGGALNSGVGAVEALPEDDRVAAGRARDRRVHAVLIAPRASAGSPQAAIDPGGDAVFTWARSDGTNERIQARARSAIGALSAVQTLSDAGQDAADPHVGIDDTGDAVFVWERVDGSGDKRVEARTRSAAGALGLVAILSVGGRDARLPQVAVDADGDAAAIWQRFDGATDRVQAAFGP